MPNKVDRAKLFLSFDALKGFQEYLRQQEKVVVKCRQLSEDEYAQLEWKIHMIKPNDIITIVYFVDEEYIKLCGMVAKIDLVNHKTIQIVNKIIPIKNIIDIELEKDIN